MSLAIDKYERLEDARMRLRGTVVRYDGEPVYIKDVVPPQSDKDGIFRVIATGFPVKTAFPGRIPQQSDEDLRKFISSKHFDASAFRLGYVNHPKGVFYCSRIPARQQKQGLSGDTLRSVTNAGDLVSFSTFLSTKEVIDMVRNNYPTFEMAKRALTKAPSVAFSRDFCLERDVILDELIHLYHKADKVGAILNGEIVLGKKFKCLTESLRELGVNMK